MVTLLILAGIGWIPLFLFYLGLTGDPTLLPIAEGFGGSTLLLASSPTITVGEFAPKKFLSQHALFFVGAMMVLDSLKAGSAVNSVNSFEMGSFALIITGFFLSREEDFYRGALLYSVSATAFLFIAGTFRAFDEVINSSSLPIAPNPNLVHVTSSLFILGVIDLLVLAFQFFLILLRKHPNYEGTDP